MNYLTSFFKNVDEIDESYIERLKKAFGGKKILIALPAIVDESDERQKNLADTALGLTDSNKVKYKITGGLMLDAEAKDLPGKGSQGGPSGFGDGGNPFHS